MICSKWKVNKWPRKQSNPSLKLECRVLSIIWHCLPIEAWFIYSCASALFSTEVSVACVCVFYLFLNHSQKNKRHGDSNHHIIKRVHLYCEASLLLPAQFNWWLGWGWCWFRHHHLLGFVSMSALRTTAGRIFQVWNGTHTYREEQTPRCWKWTWKSSLGDGHTESWMSKKGSVLKSKIFGESGLWVRESNLTFNKWMTFNKFTTWSHL